MSKNENCEIIFFFEKKIFRISKTLCFAAFMVRSLKSFEK